MPPRFPVVFIVGVGHSGSNLLSRLLSRHARIACVGETAWAGYAVAKGTPCTCGEAYADCDYWGSLLPRLEGDREYDYRRFTPELFEHLRRASGRDVLVDNSKTRVWRMARRWKGVGFLFLVRDSRGVLASGLRKGGRPLEYLLKRHRKWVHRWARFAERRADETLVLRYEDLAREPTETLERVTDFLGVERDGALLSPSDAPYHFMYSHKTGSLDRGEAIRLDERWRDELPREAQARIQRSMRRVRLYRELYPDADTGT
ncbi:MAG: sulfotransferase [Planctomycetota bacterium]